MLILPLVYKIPTQEDYVLKDDELKKIVKEKEKDFFSPAKQKIKPTKTNTAELVEIDLHIEELVNDWQRMSNSEILITQMSVFRTHIDRAINNNTKKVVFIHGVGNGVLKHEIRKTLSSDYPECKYQDASYKEYGYGATLVFPCTH